MVCRISALNSWSTTRQLSNTEIASRQKECLSRERGVLTPRNTNIKILYLVMSIFKMQRKDLTDKVLWSWICVLQSCGLSSCSENHVLTSHYSSSASRPQILPKLVVVKVARHVLDIVLPFCSNVFARRMAESRPWSGPVRPGISYKARFVGLIYLTVLT